jgi:hypothetical protein
MSTARTRLEKQLEKSLSPLTVEHDDAAAVDLLHGFAQQISKLLNPPSGDVATTSANVTVELGHLVNKGQEYRVVVRAPKINLVDILLRAFIPMDGFPVHLDMFAEGEASCTSEDELVIALVKVSQQPALRERLANIRRALRDPDLKEPGPEMQKARVTKTKRGPKKSSAA